MQRFTLLSLKLLFLEIRLEYIRYNTQFCASALETVCWCYHYNLKEDNLLPP